MRFVSLFSGIEAASVAWMPLGWEAVAFAEIEPFPCAVPCARWIGERIEMVERLMEGD